MEAIGDVCTKIRCAGGDAGAHGRSCDSGEEEAEMCGQPWARARDGSVAGGKVSVGYLSLCLS